MKPCFISLGYYLSLLALTLFLVTGCEEKEPEVYNPGTVTDIDGNVYQTIVIGKAVWMAENLRTTKYRNGDAIPEITDSEPWETTTEGAFCNYDNSTGWAAIYGKLYNWYAVNDSRNLAPEGWHVATEQDWQNLSSSLGGGEVAGGKLKETGTLHWASPNVGATDDKGFKAIPGGFRYLHGQFDGLTFGADWWSTTQSSATQAYLFVTENDKTLLAYGPYSKNGGNSVRCVMD